MFGFLFILYLDRPQSESSEFLDDVIRDLRSVATAGYRENIRAIVFKVRLIIIGIVITYHKYIYSYEM